MQKRLTWAALAVVALGLSACGGGSDGPDRGAVRSGPTTKATFATAADLKAALSATSEGAQLLMLSGEPLCGVRVSSIEYTTVGGRGEEANASTAVMVPQGTDAACTGARPVVVYAHGTEFDRKSTMADPLSSESALVLAMFAAQGYIVVAPNYVGYDVSTSSYHPYPNAEQQSSDVIDAMRATRDSMKALGATDSGKLFVTGYSQGGYVAMATARALESSQYSKEFNLTASGPMSGPYSLSNMVKTVFAGGVNFGAFAFTPMLTTSWQKSYGNLYATPADAYEKSYAGGIETVLPLADGVSLDDLFAKNQLTRYLFASDPLVTNTPMDAVYAAGVGTPNLMRTSYRKAVADSATHPLRVAAARNDLLNWTPSRPMILCYGAKDPVVFGSNTTDAMTYFQSRNPAAQVARMDLEDASTVGPAFAAAFAEVKKAVSDAAGGGAAGEMQVVETYHELVAPFCTLPVRALFNRYR